MKVNLTKAETAALMDKFKSKRVGKIKYAEFLDALGLGEEGGGDDEEDEEESEEEDEDRAGKKKKKKKKKKGSRKKDGDFAAMVRKEINRMARGGKGKPKLKSVFNTFDRNGNSKLSVREFKRALSKMGFEFSSSEMARLMERLDEDGDEQISWKEFERFSRLAADGSDGEDGCGSDEDEDDDMITTEEMRTLIKKQFKKLSRAGDAPNVKRVFSRLDIDSSDYISKREFKKACEDMGFEFSSGEMKSFLKKFDKKDNGKIHYAGFVKLAKGDDDDDDSEAGDADVDDLALMVRKELKRLTKSSRGPPKVRKVFEDLDSNGNGTISKREFKNGLRDMGFKFKMTEMDDLMDYLDGDGNGLIDFEEYEKVRESMRKRQWGARSERREERSDEALRRDCAA